MGANRYRCERHARLHGSRRNWAGPQHECSSAHACHVAQREWGGGDGIKAAHMYAMVPRTECVWVAIAFVVSCRAMLKSVRTTRPESSNSTLAGFTCGTQNATRGRQLEARHRTHSSESGKTVNFARLFDMFDMRTCARCESCWLTSTDVRLGLGIGGSGARWGRGHR